MSNIPDTAEPRRTEYVLDDQGWDDPARLDAVYRILRLLAPSMTSAQLDMPWDLSPAWPSDVASAATRLRERFIPDQARDATYLWTGVQEVLDDQARSDFVAFAPYALDATLWGKQSVLAELADEGTSVVVSLTEVQREELGLALGDDRLVDLAVWRERHPSLLRRLMRAVSRRR